MTIFVIIIVVLVILILAVGILFFVYVYRNKKRRVHDEEWPVKMPENVSQINLERVVLRTELGLKDSEMMDIVSDLTPLRHLKAERLSYIASLLAQLLSSFECVGYPAVDNPLISLLKIIAAESGTSPPHDSVLITPVARIYLERALATNFCLPQPLTLAKECVQSLELMLAALKKMEDAKKSAAESEEEFETRLLVLKAEMDKVCNDAEICMKDKMHELEGQIALLRAERDKFNSRALEAEATALMMEQKSKDEAIETRTRIRHLREELEDLGADELNMIRITVYTGGVDW
ncbi:hypothetical protein BC830DRAFT_216136 [Chytriomyces sp. MP71]|nr:hypothetical protein BC830DRAFT_216136 [Chytriomyces sp. MP71]